MTINEKYKRLVLIAKDKKQIMESPPFYAYFLKKDVPDDITETDLNEMDEKRLIKIIKDEEDDLTEWFRRMGYENDPVYICYG